MQSFGFRASGLGFRAQWLLQAMYEKTLQDGWSDLPHVCPDWHCGAHHRFRMLGESVRAKAVEIRSLRASGKDLEVLGSRSTIWG